MSRPLPHVLLVGAYRHHEFAVPLNWLLRHTQLSTAATVEQALAEDGPPETDWHTVVLAQARPGQIRQADIDRLGDRFPLANLVALLGSWCEGETRSGSPWPGVVRVYWHQWPARCQQQLLISEAPTSWQLPRTVSAVERSTHAVLQGTAAGSGLVAIHTRRVSFFRSLASACQAGGYAAAWVTTPHSWMIAGAHAVLWDGEHGRDQAFAQLRDVAMGMDPVPVIALLGFPRHNDVSRAAGCGAAAVLPCPFLLTDLWALLAAARPDRSCGPPLPGPRRLAGQGSTQTEPAA
jgi:hypothetical protein